MPRKILMSLEKTKNRHQQGFSLLEMLVVLAIVGVIAAILAPGWVNVADRNRLTTARDKLHIGIKTAQSEAQYKSTGWRFSVRERGDSVEWAVHPSSSLPINWETIESKPIKIDSETSFAKSGAIYYVHFDEMGNPHRLGRLTLSGNQSLTNKRCVIVSTLIGATRTSKEQKEPEDGRLCY